MAHYFSALDATGVLPLAVSLNMLAKLQMPVVATLSIVHNLKLYLHHFLTWLLSHHYPQSGHLALWLMMLQVMGMTLNDLGL